MTTEQKSALHWVLIEACATHADRDLEPNDMAEERRALECLLELLEEYGDSTEHIRTWLPSP